MTPKTREVFGRFWDSVSALLETHNIKLWENQGYVEITTKDRVWRSFGYGPSGDLAWVSWEPYEIIWHFTQLCDPEAQVRYISNKKGSRP